MGNRINKVSVRKNKKGVEIAMNTTIMALLALIAFIFIVFLMTDKFGMFNKSIKDCKINQGEVVSDEKACSEKGGTIVGTPDKETKKVCCITQCSSMRGECVSACKDDSNSKYKCVSVAGCSTCQVPK